MNMFSEPFPQDKWIDEAVKLRERVAQLESALKKIIDECETCGGYGVIEYQPSGLDGWLPTGDANFVTEDCPHCAEIRALLKAQS